MGIIQKRFVRGGPRFSTRILVKPYGTRLGIRKGGKGAVRLPKIRVPRGWARLLALGRVVLLLVAGVRYIDVRARPAPAPALVLEYPPEH